MANPTSNFGWQMPTNTDLVKDLPADFETFGQAVDSDLADLKGGTTGQVLSKNSDTDMDFAWVTSDDANAIQNAIVDAKGDLITATAADTPARLAVGNDGETIVADSAASTGLRWQGNYAAAKNKIINGDFSINQRSFSSTTLDSTFTFDRFFTGASDGTSTFTAETFTPGTAPVAGYEGINYLRMVSTGQTATTAQTRICQRIEDVRTFAGQTITVSFWAKASTGTPNLAINVSQTFGSGGSSVVTVSGQKFAITSSWVRYSKTFSVPSVSGKTIGAGSSLRLNIWSSAGTDRNTDSDSLGIQSITVDIWGVQVEAGSVATAFQTATGTLQGETALCQRYYYRVGGSNLYERFAQGYATSTTNVTVTFNQPITMRVAPTAIDYSTVLVADGVTVFTVTGLTIDQASRNVSSLNASVASGLTQFRPYGCGSNNSTSAYIGLSAEL